MIIRICDSREVAGEATGLLSEIDSYSDFVEDWEPALLRGGATTAIRKMLIFKSHDPKISIFRLKNVNFY